MASNNATAATTASTTPIAVTKPKVHSTVRNGRPSSDLGAVGDVRVVDAGGLQGGSQVRHGSDDQRCQEPTCSTAVHRVPRHHVTASAELRERRQRGRGFQQRQAGDLHLLVRRAPIRSAGATSPSRSGRTAATVRQTASARTATSVNVAGSTTSAPVLYADDGRVAAQRGWQRTLARVPRPATPVPCCSRRRTRRTSTSATPAGRRPPRCRPRSCRPPAHRRAARPSPVRPPRPDGGVANCAAGTCQNCTRCDNASDQRSTRVASNAEVSTTSSGNVRAAASILRKRAEAWAEVPNPLRDRRIQASTARPPTRSSHGTKASRHERALAWNVRCVRKDVASTVTTRLSTTTTRTAANATRACREPTTCPVRTGAATVATPRIPALRPR